MSKIEDLFGIEELDQVQELAPGVTTQEIRAKWLDEEALVEPPYKLFQLNSEGCRYYYRFVDGTPEFYPSVTTITAMTLPKAEHLMKWIADMGWDESRRYMNERASYGTFMHAIFEKLIIARTYNLDGLKDDLLDYMKREGLPDNFIYYADDLKKDLLAFAQFVRDYDVRPMAVEIALVHPEFGYAGMLDLPCTMKEKPGSENRIRAIVDFKSGRKGFHEENEIQLHLYRLMWNANFPDSPIDRVFNFAPKDWRKSPTYTLKDQTNCESAAKVPALLELARIEIGKRKDTFSYVQGVVDLDGGDFGDNIVSLTLAEIVSGRNAEKPQEPASAGDEAPEGITEPEKVKRPAKGRKTAKK